VHDQPLVPVGDFPSGVENQTATVLQQVVIDFVGSIPRAVIVRVGPIKIEYDRNVVLGKVIMVAPIIKSIGVVLIVIGVIKLDLGVFVVHFLGEFVQFRTQFVGANQVQIVPFPLIVGIDPPDHIDVQVGNGL